MNENAKSAAPAPGQTGRFGEWRFPAVPKLGKWRPLVVPVAVFLVGFIPMWFKASRLEAELDRAQQELRLAQIQTTLANAALDARHGEYEPARQAVAQFYKLVTEEADRGVRSAFSEASRASMQPLLAQRDDLITLLARGDPTSGERLASVYVSFRKSLAK